MASKQVNSLSSSTPTIDDLTISYDNADTSELKQTTWSLVKDLFASYFPLRSNNLSDLSNASTARTNLWLSTKSNFNTACTDWDFVFSWDNATSLNMSTAKVLWRSTASSGAVEEISIWTGLSLSWGTLSNTSTGWLTRDVWYSLTWTFATATTFTTTESSSAEATRLAWLAERALFTCTNSGGSTRRIGYIKSATTSTTTVTYTVVTDSDLASWDIAFKIAPQRMVEDYKHLISIPWEQIADTSNPQWTWLLNIKRDAYLLPVNTAVRTAAAGSGAALAYNVYKGSTNLFTTAPDMTTNTTLSDQRPNTNTITAGDNVSLRITSSAWATNKASDFQAELYIIPQKLYTSQ